MEEGKDHRPDLLPGDGIQWHRPLPPLRLARFPIGIHRNRCAALLRLGHHPRSVRQCALGVLEWQLFDWQDDQRAGPCIGCTAEGPLQDLQAAQQNRQSHRGDDPAIWEGPKLRAKGAETKGCLPFVVTVAIDMAAKRPTDSKYQSIAACASCLFEFYALLDQEVFRADAAAEACRRYCLLYSALSEQASDERYWRKKPKMHMFQELAEFQAYDLGHPARFWCYADESFVGMIAKMAMPRGGPRNAAVSARNILDRFRALAQES